MGNHGFVFIVVLVFAFIVFCAFVAFCIDKFEYISFDTANASF
jgi:hypothetical protein